MLNYLESLKTDYYRTLTEEIDFVLSVNPNISSNDLSTHIKQYLIKCQNTDPSEIDED